jgi:hypothetical protein
MNEKTLVLDIQELYNVIPETKFLEGKNFKDIRELLIELIAAIETTGQWEFIQYVNNKPSLFVIRKVPSSTFESNKFKEFERMYKDVKNLTSAARTGETYVSSPYEGTPVVDMGQPEEVLKNDTMAETEREVESNLKDTYVPSIKLPWE